MGTSPRSSLHTSHSFDGTRKKIIVCCDGTACTAYKGDDQSPPTNVARIARCIKPKSRNGVPQVVHYMPGIGTGEESDWNPLNFYNLGIGRGVEEKIIQGYSFICHNYTTSQDQIILIGFSRGAFVIRCIADLVHRVGVLTKFGLYYIREIYDEWRRAGENKRTTMEEVFGPVPDFRNEFSASPQIREDYIPVLDDEDEPNIAQDGLDILDNDLDFLDVFEGDSDYDSDYSEVLEVDITSAAAESKPPMPTMSTATIMPVTPTTPTTSTTSDHSKDWFEKRLKRKELLERIRSGDTKIIRRGIRVEVCAAWDTVGALGPLSNRLGCFRPRQYSKLGFIRSDLNQGINNAFQALSLHDRRRSFLPIVWSRPPAAGEGSTTRLEQCWFMGYHGDVGGGRHGEGLAHFPLAWMLGKLSRFVDMDAANFWSPRLSFSNWRLVPGSADKTARLRIDSKDSLTPLFWLGGADCRKPRRQFWTEKGFRELPCNKLEIESVASDEFMHFSVQWLAQEKAMKPCKSLRHAEIPSRSGLLLPNETHDADQAHSRVVWKIPMRPGWRRLAHWLKTLGKSPTAVPEDDSDSANEYPVNEAPMKRVHGCNYPELWREIDLVRKWYDSELEVLQKLSDYNENKTEPDIELAEVTASVHEVLENFVEEMIHDLEPGKIQHWQRNRTKDENGIEQQEAIEEGYTIEQVKTAIQQGLWGSE